MTDSNGDVDRVRKLSPVQKRLLLEIEMKQLQGSIARAAVQLRQDNDEDLFRNTIAQMRTTVSNDLLEHFDNETFNQMAQQQWLRFKIAEAIAQLDRNYDKDQFKGIIGRMRASVPYNLMEDVDDEALRQMYNRVSKFLSSLSPEARRSALESVRPGISRRLGSYGGRGGAEVKRPN